MQVISRRQRASSVEVVKQEGASTEHFEMYRLGKKKVQCSRSSSLMLCEPIDDDAYRMNLYLSRIRALQNMVASWKHFTGASENHWSTKRKTLDFKEDINTTIEFECYKSNSATSYNQYLAVWAWRIQMTCLKAGLCVCRVTEFIWGHSSRSWSDDDVLWKYSETCSFVFFGTCVA